VGGGIHDTGCPGPHLLTAGVTYMPVFTSSMTIHAVGFVIGYQYIRIR
jgi:hypothetical protein